MMGYNRVADIITIAIIIVLLLCAFAAGQTYGAHVATDCSACVCKAVLP